MNPVSTELCCHDSALKRATIWNVSLLLEAVVLVRVQQVHHRVSQQVNPVLTEPCYNDSVLQKAMISNVSLLLEKVALVWVHHPVLQQTLNVPSIRRSPATAKVRLLIDDVALVSQLLEDVVLVRVQVHEDVALVRIQLLEDVALVSQLPDDVVLVRVQQAHHCWRNTANTEWTQYRRSPAAIKHQSGTAKGMLNAATFRITPGLQRILDSSLFQAEGTLNFWIRSKKWHNHQYDEGGHPRKKKRIRGCFFL